MRSVIIFLFSLFIFFIIIALVGLLLPSKVTITKSVLINATSDRIRSQILDFNNWKNWYPPLQNENVSVIANPPKKNALRSVSVKDYKGEQVDFDLIYTSRDTLVVAVKSQSSTKLYYQFLLIPHLSGKMQLTLNVNTVFKWYPWEKIKGVFLDKISGPQYEAALSNLKKLVEK
ncbi:MAG: hypothetical protein ABI172_13175 [Ginsengibacter sp.]